ncbi:uncharacterized protein LOC129720283 [Wyeomyia smithii]|uniref:uncharacterized protein LOC129720283 n=1 Tax=Wyeomyia smithii TaxID=174621 RepID=UPI002467BE3C|nr:uncharacterized protein LOC129720283 [Wyeomyia smithii]
MFQESKILQTSFLGESQLKETQMWWEGPPWLRQSERFWPPLVRTVAQEFPVEQLEEATISLQVQVQPPSFIFALRSSFISLIRPVAYMLRFAYNARKANRLKRRKGFLQTDELNESVCVLARIAQEESFAGDIRSVATSDQVKSNSRLKTLAPILKDDILRVGGRLRYAPVSEERNHPIILPPNHPFTELVMVYYHEKLLHAGPQLLIATIRGRFWPLRVRNLARRVVHQCMKCFRCKPTVFDQPMGDLPAERVNPTYPFIKTGVDLCEPIYYRHTGRKSAPIKGYVAIFVCLVTKAVHIELVADLSTNAFIAVLKRFVARRGKPTVIECDNAKNFLGASRELAELSRHFGSLLPNNINTW